MPTTRLVAALCAALLLSAHSALAQEAPAVDSPAIDAPADAGLAPVKVFQAIVTGYATGGDGGAVGAMTATGTRTRWGTVAADWRLYPPGTKLQIEGFPTDVFTVEDSGGAVKGNILDVWFPDLPSAEAFGTRTLKVTVLAPADH